MDKKFVAAIIVLLIIVLIGMVLYFVNDNVQEQIETKIIEDNETYIIKTISAKDKKLSEIGLTAGTLPVIDGATSTQPIRSLMICSAFDADCGWYETESREMFIWYTFSDNGLVDAKDQETIRSKTDINSKTHEAYMNLIQGENDLILVSTKPSAEEMAEAEKLGVKLELVPIGLDGFVFLVNEENTLKNLNSQDIIDIYTRKIDNWEQFTGKTAKIIPYTRPENSGSQELMEKLVMKGIKIDDSLKTEFISYASMSGLIEGVETEENSIGYSLYYYKNNMIDKRDLRPNVKLISVNGIEPKPETISSGMYPYTFNIYAVTRTDEPKYSTAYQIKEWLTSEEGQKLIQQAGYVRLYN